MPSLAQAHTDLLAKMRHRAHRPARVGAALIVSPADLIERGRPTNQGIQALAADVRGKLVYGHPADLRAEADDTDKAAATWEAAGVPKNGELLRAHAAQLRADADRFDGLIPTLPAGQADAQIAFSAQYFDFVREWDDWYACVQDAADKSAFNPLGLIACDYNPGGLTGNQLLDKVDEYDKRYRTFVDRYTTFGHGAPSFVPEKSDFGNTFGPGGLINVPKLDIPWGKIFLGAAGLAAIYWIVTRPAASAPPREHEPLRLRSPLLDAPPSLDGVETEPYTE